MLSGHLPCTLRPEILHVILYIVKEWDKPRCYFIQDFLVFRTPLMSHSSKCYCKFLPSCVLVLSLFMHFSVLNLCVSPSPPFTFLCHSFVFSPSPPIECVCVLPFCVSPPPRTLFVRVCFSFLVCAILLIVSFPYGQISLGRILA